MSPSLADTVVVPEGYTVDVIAPWGEPVGIAGAMPPWRPDVSHSAADQARQLGMHHDGMQYPPLDGSRRSSGAPGPDAANPRPDNRMGHIIRWREGGDDGADFDATTMRWDHLLLAGDPASDRPQWRGTARGDAFACPDGLVFDPHGLLWIHTDLGPSAQDEPAFAAFGHNQLLACDPVGGEVRRFLTGPVNAEIAGACFTPDACTMFVNVQHPGETPHGASDPADPTRLSRWPDGARATRPRSATLVIRRRDGGPVGG